MLPLVCRQCHGAALDDLGPIPAATVFAGQTLDPPWSGGSLYRCRRCHLGFRHPIRSDEAYEALYARASDAIWVSGALRPDHLLVRDRIEAIGPSVSVLDVGCYDGVLLAALGPAHRKFGVEASAAAAAAAGRRGVDIVAAKIRDIASLTERYDVVSAVDVIEHVADPLGFLAMLAGRLAPGGTLLISTGNLDLPAWRFAGGRYWYCSFPEHISFISPGWARAAAAALGLDVVDIRHFAYGDIGIDTLAKKRRSYYRKVLRARLRHAVSACWPGAQHRQAGAAVQGHPGLFEDHILVAFRKAPAS
jgi:SAM-dependent methyltransferase